MGSGPDEFLEHRRRYKLSQVEDVARRADLTVNRGSYVFGSVFPIAATLRLVGNMLGTQNGAPRSQMKRHSRLVNEILAALCSEELPIVLSNRLIGLTAFCLAAHP